MRRWTVALLALLMAAPTLAAIDTWQFKNEAQEQAFREITSQLRCPKCQNNSIADSNAMIAADMRLKVYELMQQGQSKEQIIAYMVARYGNFVSYQPPLTAATLLLWLVPGLFVAAGAAVLVTRARRRDPGDAALSAEERQRLARLLNQGDEQ
ncbi:cytochrome c-type biogenesis protein CcmH [Klebsiella sp. NPDC088457]|uniref:cytochrome c-type biogenesis protein n=1 Tax=Raoultella sp. BIGb0138 TaxID=2485115 RepID=UPI001052E670|nr:cytochrome c-type biogenesis protein [Raoultella sp. BIGb0138]